MNEAELTLKPIQNLLIEQFFIPEYQRGYRWSKEEVEDLLKDLNEFRSTPKPTATNTDKEPFYCLQPIVVKKTKENLWEVIDGQQRLTTILLILHFLNETEFKKPKPIYSIEYATRGHSENFLYGLDSDEFRLENVDYYHLYEAYATIKAWFEEIEKNNSAIQGEMYPIITNHAEVIWYDISNTDESAIEVFTRLNIGKIPLTNAELIKALFLREANFERNNANLKQIQIASEWDMIENTLQQDNFWFFIYNDDNPFQYDTRIEFIFDLMYERKLKHSDRYTYNKFAEEFRNLDRPKLTQEIDFSWQKIKRYFLTIQEWYEDPKWYHLIGYLVSTGENLANLKEESEYTTKDNFEKYLHSRIRKRVQVDLDDLSYYGNKQEIWNVLLLFNVQTILKSESADIKFPFHKLKSRKHWDIEHIASQTNISFGSDNKRRAWISDVVDYLTGNQISSIESEEKLTHLLPDDLNEISKQFWECYYADKIDINEFDFIRRTIESYFKEDSIDPQLLDGIGNLAILDDYTNRSYKNALFPVKRKRIIKNDSTGVMVPLCTKNVFMKFYSGRLSDVMYWQDSDIKGYKDAIRKTLKEYLPKTTSNE